MAIFSIIGLCIVASVVALFLKQYRPEFSLIFVAAAGSFIVLIIVVGASGLLDELREIFELSGIDNDIFKVVLKALGVCYITSFGADLCRDFGQTSLAGKIEFAGKVGVVFLTLPLVKQILNTALELIK